MTKHIKYNSTFHYSGSTYPVHAEIDIFQSSYDDIAVFLKFTGNIEKWFNIRVHKKTGFSIKINKTSVSNENGSAEDLINFFDTQTGKAFIKPMIQKVYFDNPKRDRL